MKTKLTILLPLLLLCFVNLTIFGQTTQTHKVDFSNIDGFSGYVEFTSIRKGFAATLAGKDTRLVLKDYRCAPEEKAALQKAGIDFWGYSGYSPGTFGIEVVGQAYLIEQYVKTNATNTSKLHLNNGLGDFRSISFDEGTKKRVNKWQHEHENKSYWETYGGFNAENVTTLYLSDLKTEIQHILYEHKQEKEQKEQAEKEEKESYNTNSSISNQNSVNEINSGTSSEPSNPVQDYIDQDNKNTEAINKTKAETFDKWGKGNYIEGTAPLANEFAKQGNAAGAYGTVGVAVGAQIISMLGSGKSAEEKQKEELERELDSQIRKSANENDFKKSLDLCADYIRHFPNHPKGYYDAASLLLIGGNGLKKDEETAFLLAQKSVELIKNNSVWKIKYFPQAFYLLGQMYYNGKGTEKNYEKAFECFKEAAKRDWYGGYPVGFKSPHFNSDDILIGWMIFMGHGTTKNEAKGLKMLKHSVRRRTGRYVLGRIYYEGIGMVSKDIELTKKYLVQAIKGDGYSYGLRAIEFLEKMYAKGELGKDAEKIMKYCAKKKKSAHLHQDIETIFFAEENDKNYEKIQTLTQTFKELKKLHDDQLITEEEYNMAKKALLEK